MEQYSKLQRDTLQLSTQPAASRHTDAEITTPYSGPQSKSHALQREIVLTLKLSKTVFYGR